MKDIQIEIFNSIKGWEGIEKGYWKAIEILDKSNMLKPIELQTLKRGRNCYNDDLVTLRMLELRKNILPEIEIVSENIIPEVKVENIVPENIVKISRKQRKRKK